MELQSNRLILRPVVQQDVDLIHALHSLPETDRYNTLGIPRSLEETKTLVNGWINEDREKKQVFCIKTKEGDFVGIVGINIGKINYRTAETWYKLVPAQWNKGYATETVIRILDFCFEELNMHRIEAGCAEDNVASKKVLEKSGFLPEGLKRKILPIRGEWHNAYFFAVLEEDHQKKTNT